MVFALLCTECDLSAKLAKAWTYAAPWRAIRRVITRVNNWCEFRKRFFKGSTSHRSSERSSLTIRPWRSVFRKSSLRNSCTKAIAAVKLTCLAGRWDAFPDGEVAVKRRGKLGIFFLVLSVNSWRTCEIRLLESNLPNWLDQAWA